MKVYLAFINGHRPPAANDLAEDLRQRTPFAVDYLKAEFSLKPFFSPERRQYYSTAILAELLKRRPADGEKILGVTDVDLYVPILTFLFGEAQLNGPGALISTHRLHAEFYGLPRDPRLLYERTLKEALHELGHTVGLVHCPDYRCVMHSSTSVEDSDLKEAAYCDVCSETVAGYGGEWGIG